MLTVGIDEARTDLDGVVERVREEGAPLRLEEDGKPLAVLLPVAEVERLQRLAAAGAPDPSARGQGLFDHASRMASLGYWEWDEIADRCIRCSDELGRLFGVTANELVRRMNSTEAFFEWVHPDDRGRVRSVIEDARRQKTGFDVEYRIVRGDGTVLDLREVNEVALDSAGRMAHQTGVIQDITEHKRVERELARSAALLESIYTQIPGAVYRRIESPSGGLRYEFVSAGVRDLLGIEADAVMANPRIFFDNIHPGDRDGRAAAIERASGQLERYDIEYRYLKPSGETAWIRAIADPELLENGEVSWTGLTLDITSRKRLEAELRRSHEALEKRVEERTRELKQTNEALHREIDERREAEEALRESEERLSVITDNLPALIAYVDADERYRFANKRCCEWYARPLEEIIGKRIKDIYKGAYGMFAARMRQVKDVGAVEFEDRVTYPDGVTRDTRATWLPHYGPDGALEGVFSLVEDLTDIKQAEERARQSQKMEAVGQLTGGVAHDFNNLLAVIIGNVEMLIEDFPEDPSPKAILRAARRGTELTQRLLAFSRRQPLDPRPIDLVELVDGMSAMLHRTLGETIEIAAVGEEGLWQAMADPGQVENALLNLAINARDAMPGGGKLTIECTNSRLDEATARRDMDAVPGEYVVLAVSDTGTGMPPEILEHVFEPFFTTKEVGQGTGLGLSMVYGFAKQSGGHLSIFSEPGKGTSVKLYLPRSREEAEDASRDSSDRELARGKGETVLLVEDDADVRELVAKVLTGLGYRVIQAREAEAARSSLEEAKEVDLLLSDVILPGPMSGPDFAREVRVNRPDLKILFMSGYPAEAARSSGFSELGAPLLKKPLDRRELAEALRSALDNRSVG